MLIFFSSTCYCFRKVESKKKIVSRNIIIKVRLWCIVMHGYIRILS
jgi:hypothetical protein